MRILIATDGSDYSNAAITECCKMVVDPRNAEILIVSAYDDMFPLAAEPFAMSPEYYQQLEDAVREQTTDVVDAAKKLVVDQFPGAALSIETEVLRGSPDQQITEKAKEWNADLIVVGSHGRGFWGRLLGSVSNGVMHHAPCSVMVVRKP
ncbi:MAG: universal stress protein [Pyrinomonadaceae bacterium]